LEVRSIRLINIFNLLKTAKQVLFSIFLTVIPLQLNAIEEKRVALEAGAAFVYPLETERVTSSYGIRHHPVKGAIRHHHGVDLAAKTGTPIRSIASGKVIFSGYFGAYGYYVSILHDNGYTSHYGHCQALKVKIGEKVMAGDLIATVGSSGLVTGSHLHFELRLRGRSLDPEQFIPDIAARAEG
jgi:murein DD-endopeptidase MepM/ murein hydrolase activator NlpD